MIAQAGKALSADTVRKKPPGFPGGVRLISNT